MKKSLVRDIDRNEILQRIRNLTPISPRQWGQMSVGGMMCHLHDSYRVGLGEIPVEPVKMPVPGSVVKYLALSLSIPWSKNLKTTEEVRQGGLGTRPGIFAEDRIRLMVTVERFCLAARLDRVKHPIFGRMTHEDWLRWGYLHADHHLRQFGV